MYLSNTMSTRSNLDISSSIKSFKNIAFPSNDPWLLLGRCFLISTEASMMTVVTPLSMKIASFLNGCFSVKETKLSTTLAFVANFTAPVVGIVNQGGGSATSHLRSSGTMLVFRCWAAINMLVRMSEDFFANTLVVSLTVVFLKKPVLFYLIGSNTDRLLSINTSLTKFLRLALPNSSTL